MGWLLFIIGTIGWHVGMYGMFKKAGIEPWKALIPFYNTWCIVEKCRLPKIWFWLQLIPIAGQFVTIWITIIFVMHFGKFTVIDHALTVFLPFIYFPYLGFSKERYKGPEVLKLYKKPASREWIDAAVFAIVAATLIRTFIFEAYVIPTGSMERTLLVNDFLFVNKMSYGARIPQTPLSFPFVHNTMPFSQTTPSYLKWIQLPYKRLPGFTEVKRNDVVVFNFPAGDTIINEPGYMSETPYYDVLREVYNGNRDQLRSEHDIIVHPMDKTDNYIKRCTGVPGDILQVKDGILYVNNKKAFQPPTAQIDYKVTTDGTPLSQDFLQNEMGYQFTSDENGQLFEKDGNFYTMAVNTTYILNTTPENAEKLRHQPHIKEVVESDPQRNSGVFPYDAASANWNRDNYGPITIPAKGATVILTPQNIELYRRLITVYEHNMLDEKLNIVAINAEPDELDKYLQTKL